MQKNSFETFSFFLDWTLPAVFSEKSLFVPFGSETKERKLFLYFHRICCKLCCFFYVQTIISLVFLWFSFLGKEVLESVHDDDPEDCNVLCPPRWVDLKHLTVGARLVETGRKFGTALWSFSNLTVWIVKFAQYSWSWHQAEYIKPKI